MIGFMGTEGESLITNGNFKKSVYWLPNVGTFKKL